MEVEIEEGESTDYHRDEAGIHMFLNASLMI